MGFRSLIISHNLAPKTSKKTGTSDFPNSCFRVQQPNLCPAYTLEQNSTLKATGQFQSCLRGLQAKHSRPRVPANEATC